MPFKPDPWLSRVLGRPVHRGVGRRFRPPSRWAKGFYHARIDADRGTDLRAALRAGFRLAEVAISLERSPARERTAGGPVVRPLPSADAPGLRSWGGGAFVYSRFHLDPAFARAEATAVKRAWLEEYLAGRRADRVWVALDRGRPVGFLGRCRRVEDKRRVGVLDLMAVRPSHRGRGVGRALVRRFVRDSAADCDLLRVGTQAANAPSLRLYGACGFSVRGAQFVVHAHRGGRG